MSLIYRDSELDTISADPIRVRVIGWLADLFILALAGASCAYIIWSTIHD
jgi:hypothetical protein